MAGLPKSECHRISGKTSVFVRVIRGCHPSSENQQKTKPLADKPQRFHHQKHGFKQARAAAMMVLAIVSFYTDFLFSLLGFPISARAVRFARFDAGAV
jgi:hypothetical protein